MADGGDAISRYVANHFPTVNAGYGAPDPIIPNSSGPPDDRNPAGPTSLASVTGGGGGGGAAAPALPTNPPLDWHAYLTNWGFTSDIVTELDRIFRTYSDPSQASAAAIAYVRGTDWYATTFPGIQAGMKLGVISDEASYRAYTNQLNDLYHRYYNRDVTGADVTAALTSGFSVQHVDAHFQGQAYVSANKSDIQGALGAFDSQGVATDDQLSALGDQQAGLDNLLGPEVQRRIDLAKQKMAGVFQGTLANPSLSVTKQGKLSAPSLGGGTNPTDIGA